MHTTKKIITPFGREVKVVDTASCDGCGKQFDENTASCEGYGKLSIRFGYGSIHDGDAYFADVCDECFEKLQKLFKLRHKIVY